MNETKEPSDRVGPQTPAMVVANEALEARFGALSKQLAKVSRHAAEVRVSAKAVHELRVLTRRAEAALDAFGEGIDPAMVRKLARCARRVRRASGVVRDGDVLINQATIACKSLSVASARLVIAHLQRRERKARPANLKRLAEVARDSAAKLDNLLPKLLKAIGRSTSRNARNSSDLSDASDQQILVTLAHRASVVLQRHVQIVSDVSNEDLHEIDRLHELRLAIKRLRYAMAVLDPALSKRRVRALSPNIVEIQHALGEINDLDVLIHRLGHEATRLESAKSAPSLSPASRTKKAKPNEKIALAKLIRKVIVTQRRALKSAHARVLKSWAKMQDDGLLTNVIDSVAPALPLPKTTFSPPASTALGLSSESTSTPQRIIRPAGLVELKPGATATAGATAPAHVNGTRSNSRSQKKGRIAAIDIGSNSVRLIIAELQPDGAYRVLDDEKEITRLASGLSTKGEINSEAMDHTVATVVRMQSIAKGYDASALRIVATAATREAANGNELTSRIAQATGIPVQVISGEQEALLAFRSAANSFDLSKVTSLVLDVGGGSTELVLSAAGADGGVIERVYSIPIGAVRLTELFGGPDAASGENFHAMRKHIKQELKKHVGSPPILPKLVIGTGGTLTTLGAMVIHKRHGAGDGLFAGVQGFDVPRPDLKHLLDFLRKLPTKQRSRVPGLSVDRTDIIVPGLAIVDAVLKLFDANALKVHEGGIRDGILLEMSNAPAAASERPDPMRGVRRFARSCGYEADHSKHVAQLALSIFDQLAHCAEQAPRKPGVGLGPEERMLLEAASLLHDVGYLINYDSHHKHSYHLIVHADLPGLETRQVQVIANVARYHRASEPKGKHRNFSSLEKTDQQLVRMLAGILRVADGLDRTHMQSVRSVRLRLENDGLHFAIRAEQEPSVDLWGAARKSGLFEAVFAKVPHFSWDRAHEATIEISKRELADVSLGKRRM